MPCIKGNLSQSLFQLQTHSISQWHNITFYLQYQTYHFLQYSQSHGNNLSLWQMCGLRLESVLVGDVVDGVNLTVIGGEGVRSTNNDGRRFRSVVSQLSLFLLLDSVASLNGEAVSTDAMVVVVPQDLGILVGDWDGVSEREQRDESENEFHFDLKGELFFKH